MEGVLRPNSNEKDRDGNLPEKCIETICGTILDHFQVSSQDALAIPIKFNLFPDEPREPTQVENGGNSFVVNLLPLLTICQYEDLKIPL